MTFMLQITTGVSLHFRFFHIAQSILKSKQLPMF